MIYRGEKDACENDDTTSDELHSCGAGVCRIYRVSRDGFIGFCERKTARRDTEVTITMVSDEVDEWHRHLKKKGIRFMESPPSTSAGFQHDYNEGPTLNPKFNIYHFFFKDNNGFLVEIQKFGDPKWPRNK
mmetsp:Transcript_17676/g.28239  ORF Transcript_17676/g.28239 Transcript_17676/m.28239 type:complete len:131 (-) Transcript_17676:97-489(-)